MYNKTSEGTERASEVMTLNKTLQEKNKTIIYTSILRSAHKRHVSNSTGFLFYLHFLKLFANEINIYSD